MAADRISITFDENNNIRVLEAALYNDCLQLQNESYDFINKMKKFEEMVGSLVDVLDSQAGKIEQEKLYNDRLNDQIIQERIKCDKIKSELSGPSIEKLVEQTASVMKRDDLLKKVGEKFYYDDAELSLAKKTEFFVEVKHGTGTIPLSEFLTCPRTPALRKKVSQDCKGENDGDASFFSSDKNFEKIKGESKVKALFKNKQKAPLKDKNRTGSISVERKRPFK